MLISSLLSGLQLINLISPSVIANALPGIYLACGACADGDMSAARKGCISWAEQRGLDRAPHPVRPPAPGPGQPRPPATPPFPAPYPAWGDANDMVPAVADCRAAEGVPCDHPGQMACLCPECDSQYNENIDPNDPENSPKNKWDDMKKRAEDEWKKHHGTPGDPNAVPPVAPTPGMTPDQVKAYCDSFHYYAHVDCSKSKHGLGKPFTDDVINAACKDPGTRNPNDPTHPPRKACVPQGKKVKCLIVPDGLKKNGQPKKKPTKQR